MLKSQESGWFMHFVTLCTPRRPMSLF